MYGPLRCVLPDCNGGDFDYQSAAANTDLCDILTDGQCTNDVISEEGGELAKRRSKEGRLRGFHSKR